jgi:hypothetical protein
MDKKLAVSGSDGELDSAANIWRKGIVVTKRASAQSPSGLEAGYRISVVFKRSISAACPFAGFHDLYRRVSCLADERVSALVSPRNSERPLSAILCHGWRLLGNPGTMAAAFITLGIGPRGENGTSLGSMPAPTDNELRSPGGASIEELSRLMPQSAEEIYNEFDFTEPFTSMSDPITVSYAERVPEGDLVDFEPLLKRAETFAKWYHDLLKQFGEVKSSFRVMRREWFLADLQLLSIHVCFSR